MYRKTRKTICLILTDEDDMQRYDDILNDPLSTVLREIQDYKTTTEFSGGEEGSSTTTRTPVMIVTYETKELI